MDEPTIKSEVIKLNIWLKITILLVLTILLLYQSYMLGAYQACKNTNLTFLKDKEFRCHDLLSEGCYIGTDNKVTCQLNNTEPVGYDVNELRTIAGVNTVGQPSLT